MALNITWLGHAAFFLEADGLRVLLDPYRAPDVGAYSPIDCEAEIVLVSHINPKYHSHWQAAQGTPVRLNGLDFADSPDGVDSHGIQFRAVRVWETPARDVPVSMPYFTMGGLRGCHMGDLGHRLTSREAAPVQGCDILLAVAGGPPTLALADLRDAITLLRPRVVIPMHYQTGKINLPLATIDSLIALMPETPVTYSSSPTITLTRETLPDETTFFVLPSAL